MAYAYHQDRTRYFEHQCRVTAEYVIPFIEESGALPADAHVLEVGCGEAGVLEAFLERGATAVGVDRNGTRLERGKQQLAEAIRAGRLQLLQQDAHTLSQHEGFRGAFDLIVLKDVIEHVERRLELLGTLRQLLRPGGRVFIAFPPWRMPFGGHQQICRSKVLSRLPYFHLLPEKPYARLLAAFGEAPARIDSLLATKRTGIGTSAFEDLVAAADHQILTRRLFLLNPMYSYRFGLPPMEQLSGLAQGSLIQDFVSTCAYYTIEPLRA